MTDDNAKDKKLYEKSRQIETSKARINSLSGEVSMLEQRLADLERLLALTTDAFAAYSYGASRIDDRLSLLSSLRETVISAAGAQNLLSEALTGTPVRRAAYQAEDGIGLLRNRVNNTYDDLEASRNRLRQARNDLDRLNYEYDNISRET